MKIQKVEQITKNKHLNMYNIVFIDKEGNAKPWLIASRTQPKCLTGKFDIPDAVVIVPFHQKENKLVIIKEFRVPLGDYQYGFPAGLLDEGESIEEAAQRELKEETGLDIITFKKISKPIYSSSGMTDESVSMVYVECDGEPSNKENTTSEDITIIYLSQSEAMELCKNPDIKVDVKTWLVLSSYAENGRI
ncbi:MAG: NUDIX hydrolase [Desulfobacterales bacterium]|nr:NUDIX hydrolase [Desulfobacterales bacterium]MBF0395820.1 NUDIX hydrolase [Desulfobacterales bacterium]